MSQPHACCGGIGSPLMTGAQVVRHACRFAVLIGLSNAMNELGVISFFASQIGSTLSAMNLGWGPLFGLLHVAFFYIHYLFASQTAHVGALFAAFLALMLGAGVPPMLAVLTLSFNVRTPAPCTLIVWRRYGAMSPSMHVSASHCARSLEVRTRQVSRFHVHPSPGHIISRTMPQSLSDKIIA